MSQKKKFAWSLWLPVLFAFVFVACAWFFLIKIARDNPVETIQLVPSLDVDR